MTKGRQMFVIGDIVRVSKVVKRGLDHKKHPVTGKEGYYRVLDAYPVEPVVAVVVGRRYLKMGLIYKEYDYDAYTGKKYIEDQGLAVECAVPVWLVRTGLMNREMAVPEDAIEAVSEHEVAELRKTINSRLRGPAIHTIWGTGEALTCGEEASDEHMG